MLKLLRFLITGVWHEHTWEMIERRKTVLYPHGKNRLPRGYIYTYVQKCTGCGKLKSFKVQV